MKHLTLKWSLSKGRDTYGYNICTLWDGNIPYRCLGGGYDMVGTVLGNWLEANYMDKLKTLLPHGENQAADYLHSNYGLFRSKSEPEKFYLDGACGQDCIVRIADSMGIKIRTVGAGKKYRLIGFNVEDLNQ